MALTEYEERVIAELDAQLPPDDTLWFGHLQPSPAPSLRDHGNLARFAPALACLLGGVALLLAVRHSALLVRISNVSGVPSSSITRALSLVGCMMMLGAALMVRQRVRDRRGHPR